MRLPHERHARRDELAHQRVRRVPVLARGKPVALVFRRRGVRIGVVEVPERGAGQLAGFLVRHFDPFAGRVGVEPEDLALHGVLDRGFAGGGAVIAEGEEEVDELAEWGFVRDAFDAGEFCELRVGGELGELERHCGFGGG